MAARRTAAASPVDHASLNEALLAVQAAMPAFQRDKVNPHFGSAYLSLESLMPEVLAVLQEHGILQIQIPGFTHVGSDSVVGTLTTQLIHVPTGTEITSEMLLEAGKESPQAQGSALTYARRYATTCLMGITVEKDDDGNRASPRQTAQAAVSAPQSMGGDSDLGGEL